MTDNIPTNLTQKKQAGIFIDRRSIEFLWVNALAAKNYDVDVFLSNKDLFKNVLEQSLDLIVIDSDLLSEDPAMVERYHAVSPQLFIIVLGCCDSLKNKYQEAGCNIYTNPQAIVTEFKSLNAPKEKSSEILSAIPSIDRWRLSKIDYHLYAPSNIKIKLTIKEFNLLELLFGSDKLVSKKRIEQIVIGRSCDTSAQRIAVMIARLRKKVKEQSDYLLPIKSDYTNGYLFAGQCYIEQA